MGYGHLERHGRVFWQQECSLSVELCIFMEDGEWTVDKCVEGSMVPTPITLKGIKPHFIPQCKSLFLSQLVHGIKNLLMKSSCQEMLPL